MAHDSNTNKIQLYIYDKIFRREISENQPIYDINLLENKDINSYNPNWRIYNDIGDAMIRFPKYTLQQYKDYFKSSFHIRFTRYFHDFILKQDDIPVSTAQARDIYIKLWGRPKEERYRGGDPNSHDLHYQKNLLKITKNLIKKYPSYNIQQYIGVIEKDYPVYAENLLIYLNKWKHITEDKSFNNDKKVQNPFS